LSFFFVFVFVLSFYFFSSSESGSGSGKGNAIASTSGDEMVAIEIASVYGAAASANESFLWGEDY